MEKEFDRRSFLSMSLANCLYTSKEEVDLFLEEIFITGLVIQPHATFFESYDPKEKQEESLLSPTKNNLQ